jgi:UDP-N-acetylglucosamine--N-acetylmuramyl-(pentapeptide) pyrophosphoryl-undecaprenol N-acetylglucosamine transferase
LQISGKKLFDETRELAEQTMANLADQEKQRYHLVPYMDAEMPTALQAAELVLCRSGAATLSELAVLSKPSILVPLPPALGGSPQEVNADMFGRQQAAQVIRDDDLTPEVLLDRVITVLSSRSLLESMAQAAGKIAKPEATREIALHIMTLAGAAAQNRHNQDAKV